MIISATEPIEQWGFILACFKAVARSTTIANVYFGCRINCFSYFDKSLR